MRRKDDFTIKKNAYYMARDAIKSIDGFDWDGAIRSMEIISLSRAPASEKRHAKAVVRALEKMGNHVVGSRYWNDWLKKVRHRFDVFDMDFNHNLDFEDYDATRFPRR